MPSKTFMVILTLVAILAQITSALQKYDCDEFERYLEANPPDSNILSNFKNLLGKRSRFNVEWASTMINRIKTLNCTMDFHEVARLQWECRVLDHNRFLGNMIMKFVDKCASSDYWDARLEAVERANDGLTKLEGPLSGALLQRFELKTAVSTCESYKLSSNEFKGILDSIKKIVKQNGGQPLTKDHIKEHLIDPCGRFVEQLKPLVEEAQQVMSAFHNGDTYLIKLSPNFQNEYLRFKICKYVEEDEDRFYSGANEK